MVKKIKERKKKDPNMFFHKEIVHQGHMIIFPFRLKQKDMLNHIQFG